jgi:hypothetical protein
MIAELMVANAAFAVLKESLSMGKDIVDCAEHLGIWSEKSREITAQAKGKKGGGTESDLELFMAAEKVKNQREELEYMMRSTRLNMWQEFIFFEGEQVKARRKQREKEEREKVKRTEFIMTIFAYVVAFLILAGSLFGGLKLIIGMR